MTMTQAAPGCPVDESFDPLSAEYLADPYAVLAELARRYPDLSLAPDQVLTFHPNISFRGPQSLRVRTGQATR